MLDVGSQVIYGIHGVCNIIDVQIRTIDRKKVEYFVLAPNEQPNARFFVPVRNEAALSKLRPLLSKEELVALFDAEQSQMCCWIEDENRRKLRYRELINSADRAALISMIRSLHRHRENQLSAGRKFHICDDNFLRDAKKILVSEFSLVLDISPKEVEEYIESKLN